MNLTGRIRHTGPVAALLSALVLSGCGTGPAPQGEAEQGPETAYTVAAASRSVRVVAVGDIACEPGKPTAATLCRQSATAALAQRLKPAVVLTLGDHQYEDASLANFRASYDKSWGALRSKTFPALGNHEYRTPGAKGFFDYFKGRQPGGKGYYRVTTNGWNIYVLNSNCDKVNCAAEAAWLDRQMAANPSKCSLITMHHPRYSSGFEHGSSTLVKGLWKAAYRRHNDVVLAGHDHDYERFRPMDASNHIRKRRGMVSFVSGTGGKNLYRLGKRKKGSAYFQAKTAGVLALDLKVGSFSWGYWSVDNKLMDSGSRTCR